jgi:hypothetical protein
MRGGKRHGAGRPKGTPNKDTKHIRDVFQLLIEDNTDKLQSWLSHIAKNDPNKAFDIIIKLGEYVIPKLNRTEIKDTTTVEDFLQMTPTERKERIQNIQNQIKSN